MAGIGTQGQVAPFLRWAGSKRAEIHALSPLVPKSIKTYIEPFAGSACLFFHLRPTAGILGDLNEELIETYRAIQASPVDVGQTLAEMPFGRDAYYQIRNDTTSGLSSVQRA